MKVPREPESITLVCGPFHPPILVSRELHAARESFGAEKTLLQRPCVFTRPEKLSAESLVSELTAVSSMFLRPELKGGKQTKKMQEGRKLEDL